MSQSSTDRVAAPAPIHDLGQAAFNMSYAAFRAALELEDDDYAIDKFQQFMAIGRAMGAFSDGTLTLLVEHYQRAQAGRS